MAIAPLTDFIKRSNDFVIGYIGMALTQFRDVDRKTTLEYKTYREPSPVNHASADDPPLLLIHGDADGRVRIDQSEVMEQAMKKAQAIVKLLRIQGGDHWVHSTKDHTDYIGEMVRWFDKASALTSRRHAVHDHSEDSR